MEGQRDDVALHRREPCIADGRVVGIDGVMAEHVPGADQRTWRVMILLDPNAKCEILDEDAPRMP
jgi:hypothetical protein